MAEDTEAIIKSTAEIILGLGGLGGLAAFIGQLIARRKTNAEANQIDEKTLKQVPADAAATLAGASANISDQYRKLLDEYQESTDKKISELNLNLETQQKKIGNLEKTLRHYAQRIAYLMTGIQVLTEQIVGLKLTPCWNPNDWKPEFDKRSEDEHPDPQEKV
jgi:chromosome segregation ATPase